MTVPYAIPPTAIAGQPLAAGDWNTKVRDSIESVARPPTAIVFKNVAQLVGNAGAVSVVQWTGASNQSDAFWAAGAPSRLTIPAGLGGLYLCTFNPIWDINGNGGRYGAVMVGGASIGSPTNSGGSAAWYTQHVVQALAYLNPGQYVEFGVYQNSGAALNLRGEVYPMVGSITRLGVI